MGSEPQKVLAYTKRRSQLYLSKASANKYFGIYKEVLIRSGIQFPFAGARNGTELCRILGHEIGLDFKKANDWVREHFGIELTKANAMVGVSCFPSKLGTGVVGRRLGRWGMVGLRKKTGVLEACKASAARLLWLYCCMAESGPAFKHKAYHQHAHAEHGQKGFF